MCAAGAAKGVCAWEEGRGARGAGVGCVQPGDAQDGAVQQVAGERHVSVRGPLTVRPRDHRAPSRDQAPALQDGGVPDGPCWRHVSLRPQVPLPPLSQRPREVVAGPALMICDGTTTTTIHFTVHTYDGLIGITLNAASGANGYVHNSHLNTAKNKK
jgi:hypothetical protein